MDRKSSKPSEIQMDPSSESERDTMTKSTDAENQSIKRKKQHSPSQNIDDKENHDKEEHKNLPKKKQQKKKDEMDYTHYLPHYKAALYGLYLLASKEEQKNLPKKKQQKKKKLEIDYTHYLPLYKAALKGNWESAERLFLLDPETVIANVTDHGTALYVAVSTGHSLWFVEKLVELMPVDSLQLQNSRGNSALHLAASVSNTEAAKMLVKKNPNLPQIRNRYHNTPLHNAAQHGHKETVEYLLSVTRDEDPSPFADEVDVDLLIHLIFADFYDLALNLIRKYPKLAIGRDDGTYGTALKMLSRKPSAFASGSRLCFWQRLIYSCIRVELDGNSNHHIIGRGDMENPIENSSKSFAQVSSPFQRIHINSVCRQLYVVLWNAIERLAPCIKSIRDKKLMHIKSLRLVRCICEEVLTLSEPKAKELLRIPIYIATKHGIHELVSNTIKSFPFVMLLRNNDSHDILQLAVLHRQEKIFNLVYQMSSFKHVILRNTDNSKNNILHLAGKLAPYPQLNSVSDAALQMQRELQWFKEVEKIVQPSYKERKNEEGKIPRMVFTDDHKELVKEGEKWMKDTTSSCMVVATLIATVVFAAAFTVPGGNDTNQGIPIFLRETSFMVFAISDALALFSSVTSVLMFLSILTSRYAEEDFLESLPKRLIIGLITPFFSIASMMIAFSATLFLVLGHQLAWVAIPIAILACLPVTLFALLQFPLLVEIVQATYMPRIFYQQSKEIIY